MKTYLLIILYLLSFESLHAQDKPCQDKDQVSIADTTIVLKNGTVLTFNRCDFFEIRDCMEFYEIRNLQDLEQSGLTTQDNNGGVLLTCGMFILKFNKSEDCNNKECLDYPVKIRIPILQNACLGSIPGPNGLYKSSDSATWGKVDGAKEIVDAMGNKYLEFFTKCGGRFNCDKCFDARTVKFKARNFKEIVSLKILSNCPLLKLIYYPAKRKNIVYAKIPCLDPDSLMINIVGINKSGGEEKISKPLSWFITKYTNCGCRKVSDKVKRRIIGIFPLRERTIYKKYLIN